MFKLGFNGFLVGCFLSCSAAVSSAAILVYDNNTVNHYATTAANNVDPGNVTVANAGNFNTLLTSGTWDVVLVDMPSTTPASITPLVNYINGGGKVAISFWDWDDPAYAGLVAAVGATGTTTSFSLSGNTLVDLGTTSLFTGIAMPHSSWSNNWFDDGDAFAFTLASGTIGAAKLAAFADPVMIVGNSGRTIAAPVLDEWSGAGGVQLWENMIQTLQAEAVPEPTTFATLTIGGLFGLACCFKRKRS